MEGISLVNGQWSVTVVDEDSFTITGLSIASGLYTTGGIWTMGINTIAYGGVPAPTEGKVVRRQILRNLSGNVESLYVDIDTTDLASTAFLSRATDADLAAGVPVPLTYGDDDLPYANRIWRPPSHKCVLASHKGRIFATADAVYDAGHAEVLFNRTQVQGVGTDWRKTMVGRLIYLNGAGSPYGIAGVNEATQVITLSGRSSTHPPLRPLRDPPRARRTEALYYSEPGLAESWPAYNALAIPETNDEIVGLLSFGQFLYIVERRHIHRLTFLGDPQDGNTFLSATRGSINNRTYAVADGVTYFLDEIGIHKFDGQDSTSISQPVQNLFQTDGFSDLEVDWQADQSLWHAALDPVRDTIRWFVNMVGYDGLFHAICYNYRTDRWWLEEYPTAMTASAERDFRWPGVACAVRTHAASFASRKAVTTALTGRGRFAGRSPRADSTSITDTSASFGAIEGAPVTIVEGTGRGQSRIVAGVTAQLRRDRAAVGHPRPTPPASIRSEGSVEVAVRLVPVRRSRGRPGPRRGACVQAGVGPDHARRAPVLRPRHRPEEWAPRPRPRRGPHDRGRPAYHGRSGHQDRVGWAADRRSRGAYAGGDTFISVEMGGVQAGEPVRISQLVLNDVEG